MCVASGWPVLWLQSLHLVQFLNEWSTAPRHDTSLLDGRVLRSPYLHSFTGCPFPASSARPDLDLTHALFGVTEGSIPLSTMQSSPSSGSCDLTYSCSMICPWGHSRSLTCHFEAILGKTANTAAPVSTTMSKDCPGEVDHGAVIVIELTQTGKLLKHPICNKK